MYTKKFCFANASERSLLVSTRIRHSRLPPGPATQRFAWALIILCATVTALSEPQGIARGKTNETLPEIALEPGVRDDGTATRLWTEGIAVAVGMHRALELSRRQQPLSPGAEAWLRVLEEAMPMIAERAGQLARMVNVAPLDATVVVGNRGSSDGFGWVPNFVGINADAFVETYGPPAGDATDRMVRIVAHEYLHLLTYAYYGNHSDLRQTPIDRALWTIFFEGIGDYVSVSARWLPDELGDFSSVASDSLERLEPVFVERLEMLASADSSREPELRVNIAMGKFDEKWGSLPLALWLHSESRRCGEEATLRAIFRLERDGVLELASRYAAPELRVRIRTLAARLGRPVAEAGYVGASCLADRFDPRAADELAGNGRRDRPPVSVSRESEADRPAALYRSPNTSRT
jgi:hypothetical protein